MTITSDQVIAQTQAWITHAVVGLNLCPFARAVQVKNQIRYTVSDATNVDALMAQLCEEMHFLVEADPAKLETTLLVHPQVLTDFLDFNDFLELADAALEELDYDGVLQVAPFHPQFQFEGTETGDLTNATNRAPYPTLHLLREDSVERAVAAFPNAEDIFDANIATLVALVNTVELEPAQIANGAVELLGEVSSSKITGEEDRYSHTDLSDFEANVEGAYEAYLAVKPIIADRASGLETELSKRFGDVTNKLKTYKTGSGGTYISYTALTPADTKALADLVDALGVPLSKVAAAVA